MLSPVASQADEDDAWFSAWRGRELGRLAASGLTYLDFTGAALYPESLIRGDAARLAGSVLGNPHSEHAPSRAASEGIAAARAAVLAFLRASPDEYAVILTPNTTGACRIVGESFPFGNRGRLLLAADNHNSVNGIREFARRAGAGVATISLDHELRLRDVDSALRERPTGPSLFAFPAQSNFSGVRHPLQFVTEAQARGWSVLLDAASYLGTSDLRLDEVKPDFVALSLYKIAGYPTGVGALVARHDALGRLRRPWFSGGTVRWASVQHDRHRLLDAPEGFEDGTPSFLALGAVAAALQAVRSAGRNRLAPHLSALTGDLLLRLGTLRHDTGGPVALVHGPGRSTDRGATIALSVLDPSGKAVPYWVVEETAREAGIAIRGGCFCNPGCAEAAFGFPAARTRDCLDTLAAGFTIPGFAACLGDRTVGAIRVSLGLGSIRADVDRFVSFVASFPARRDARPTSSFARSGR